ncbi:hypothetical protein LV84_03654 [Algoriphagus ratkowskyi]|uniref:Uncharacterized protein n=2 Tax=Algoriphagus ratkowskyi TaxID=57028 RepID=A0A2W7R6V5_9BACT|nr:hypothetical protein LV84_03654 [Algoriphagus ratkowskyi]
MIMQKYIYVILFFIFFPKDCFSQAKRLRDAGNVSMIEVLVKPDEFNSKKILFSGILIYEHENSAIYLSKQSAEYAVSTEAFWVRFAKGYESDQELKKLDGKYVSVYGIFDKDQFGHMGAYRGTILVERIQLRTRYRKL